MEEDVSNTGRGNGSQDIERPVASTTAQQLPGGFFSYGKPLQQALPRDAPVDISRRASTAITGSVNRPLPILPGGQNEVAGRATSGSQVGDEGEDAPPPCYTPDPVPI